MHPYARLCYLPDCYCCGDDFVSIWATGAVELSIDGIGRAGRAPAGTDSVREDHHPAQDSQRSEQDAGLESTAGEYNTAVQQYSSSIYLIRVFLLGDGDVCDGLARRGGR